MLDPMLSPYMIVMTIMILAMGASGLLVGRLGRLLHGWRSDAARGRHPRHR